MTPAAEAIALAGELGIPAGDAVVIRDLTNVLVHLRPSPVVARVSLTLADRGRDALEAELEFARLAAAAGAPVVPPADGVDPVPYERGGRLITLWRYVDHRRPGPEDAQAVGHSLRALHEALAGEPLPLPRFDRLDEVEARLATLEPDVLVSSEELALMGAAIEQARARLAALDPGEQPLHGDAHFGNVLITPDGPLWADLENVCVGPVEYDLACLAWRTRVHGTPGCDLAVAAYGAHDPELLEELHPGLGAVLAVWTVEIVRRDPRGPQGEAVRVLRERLDYLRAVV